MIDSDLSNVSPAMEDTHTDALLMRLGKRVRAARSARGMPRRVLSDVSGVSPRYLAQLESGQGNISITLLQRVVDALDLSLLDVLGEVKDQDETRLVRLFRMADSGTQSAVIQRLEVAAEVPDRAQRICLIGLRGAGKSTLGRKAGKALGLPFIELNKDIELQGGMPVAEIMALYGADGYRQLEAEAVRRVAARHDRLILAVAGGIVSDKDTYATLLARFHTIWVRTSPSEHMARVQDQGDNRPMEGQPKAMEQLCTLLDTRKQDYARAMAQLDTSDQTPEQSAAALQSLIAAHGFLD
ncbi:MAG: helix-turn-helix transcriptional regulator [Paracoccaceae bacterium]